MKKINLVLLSLVLIFACSSFQLGTKTNYPEEKLGWKLGSQAYTFRLYSFAQALDKIDSCGLRYVEIFPGQVIGDGSTEKVGAHLSKEGRQKMKKLAKDKGITIQAFGVVGAKDAAEWEEVFLFAKEMGVQVINVEPSDEHLDIVSQLCDKYKIHAALHNHPTPSKYWNPDVVLASLDGRSQYMGAAADVGHWMRSGLDPVECLKKLDGRILHLHFKDLNAFGEKGAHDVHWGTGKLPIEEVIVELKRQKFKGMLSAEYEYNWASNKDDVKQSAANFRKILSK
ncbi:sugar phosphate isomerase/epimerase family protein [Sphingobacterium rhinopitheci]|uniref:sugar phosphate isomerase/epimerase family protein n=1 Tax=Sphingobacterium rhinopitheci TaxID=2781960 RepID=UPI001F5234ED|nr:sugar phosphate isomerase/epimerase [Sphingobacterium rhinopitheci]MCI0921027.1 sugar phosphate isomerase/epimerase [Sphingobacterium rhinopitheci]